MNVDASMDASIDALPDIVDVQPLEGGIPFPQGIFRATHNSYSGSVDGMKGPIEMQLDRGVRFIELDIHDTSYATVHDYEIGHDTAGMLVDHSGTNPSTNALHDWLALIAAWSLGHPSHAPITVMFDIKDDLSAAASYAAGNPAALNDEFTAAFGTQRVDPASVANGWPSVDALRGRVMVLLSGDPTTRASYRRDLGRHPAVAVNNNGQVVELHDTAAGDLWYWTGAIASDASIAWRRHGRYGAGQTPAVALNDDGWLVEVDQSTTGSTLYSRVGQLDGQGEITWSAAARFDTGTMPSVQFIASSSGATVREIHLAVGGATMSVNGALDTTTPSLAWDASTRGATTDARFDTTTASASGHHVQVFTAADGPTPATTLRYTTEAITGGRIRYEQAAFVEYQSSDPPEMRDGAWYYAAPATQTSFITSARAMGRVVRGWDFDSVLFQTIPLANYPATNTPYASWYVRMVALAGAIE
jgi:hypothetical protein